MCPWILSCSLKGSGGVAPLKFPCESIFTWWSVSSTYVRVSFDPLRQVTSARNSEIS